MKQQFFKQQILIILAGLLVLLIASCVEKATTDSGGEDGEHNTLSITYDSDEHIFFVGEAVDVKKKAPNFGEKKITNIFKITPALPSGLSFDTNTGDITGTPTGYFNTASYVVSGTVSKENTTLASVTLKIGVFKRLPKFNIDYGSDNHTVLVGQVQTISNVGSLGGATVDWDIAPALPTGFLFDTLNGEVAATANTPTSAVQEYKEYTVTATGKGEYRGIVTKKLSIRVVTKQFEVKSLNDYTPNELKLELFVTALRGKTVTWSSSKPAIVDVYKNNLSGVEAGLDFKVDINSPTNLSIVTVVDGEPPVTNELRVDEVKTEADYKRIKFTLFGETNHLIIMKNTVSNIGIRAFNDQGITAVNLSAVKNIGESAFLDNKLKELFIPDGVTNIGKSAFSFNNDLIKVTFSSGLQTIGRSAFREGIYFKEDRFGKLSVLDFSDANSLTYIDSFAFANQKIKTVTIPNSVTNIDYNAFEENPLEEVTLSETLYNTLKATADGIDKRFRPEGGITYLKPDGSPHQ